MPDAGQSRRHFPPKTARSAVEEMEMERQVPTRRQPQATEIDTADVASVSVFAALYAARSS
jgi:hypothetical protein